MFVFVDGGHAVLAEIAQALVDLWLRPFEPPSVFYLRMRVTHVCLIFIETSHSQAKSRKNLKRRH
jgi:hypothetical protein